MNTGTSAAKGSRQHGGPGPAIRPSSSRSWPSANGLIHAGALTAFSIANDVAKYFAIIPAMFTITYPALGKLNIMRLHSRKARSGGRNL